MTSPLRLVEEFSELAGPEEIEAALSRTSTLQQHYDPDADKLRKPDRSRRRPRHSPHQTWFTTNYPLWRE